MGRIVLSMAGGWPNQTVTLGDSGGDKIELRFFKGGDQYKTVEVSRHELDLIVEAVQSAKAWPKERGG